jgi:hypothetical protein
MPNSESKKWTGKYFTIDGNNGAHLWTYGENKRIFA